MYFDAKACGRRIQELRDKLDLSQEEFSDCLHISRGYLGKIEIGIKTPSLDLLIDISTLCHVSIDYLILGTPIQYHMVETHIRSAMRELQEIKRLLVRLCPNREQIVSYWSIEKLALTGYNIIISSEAADTDL